MHYSARHDQREALSRSAPNSSVGTYEIASSLNSAIRGSEACDERYRLFSKNVICLAENLVFARRPLSLIRGISTQLEDIECWWLQTDEGPVEAWFLRAKAAVA